MRRRRRATVEARSAPDLMDARALALEIAGLRSTPPLDTVALGLVLEPGEMALRVVPLWLRLRVGYQWSGASWCQVVVTDRRLLVRLATGELVSLWWGSLVGFEADLDAAHVVLDYGDGRPRLLSGSATAVVAVAGVANLYGVEALTTHRALRPLRAVHDVASG